MIALLLAAWNYLLCFFKLPNIQPNVDKVTPDEDNAKKIDFKSINKQFNIIS
jgi:hypothetical protein